MSPWNTKLGSKHLLPSARSLPSPRRGGEGNTKHGRDGYESRSPFAGVTEREPAPGNVSTHRRRRRRGRPGGPAAVTEPNRQLFVLVLNTELTIPPPGRKRSQERRAQLPAKGRVAGAAAPPSLAAVAVKPTAKAKGKADDSVSATRRRSGAET